TYFLCFQYLVFGLNELLFSFFRSSKKTSTKKDKVKEQINSVDGLDDLTLSRETASEDCKSLYPNCKNTLRLIEQLGLESKGLYETASQELTDTRKKVSMLEASLENADLPAKVKSTSSVLLHLSAETQLFLKELLSMKELQKKSETLEEEKKKLEEVVNLRRHLEMNTVERSPVEQYKRETEERARRDVAEKWKELSQVVQYKRETEARARQDVEEKLKELSQFLQVKH
ncbi:Ankyrin repeat domain-containing protein 26, partial [Camelus dromedarius]